MEKLFESVYRECFFYNVEPIEVGQRIADTWKTNYNNTWKRGVDFIDSANYDDTDHSIIFIFKQPDYIAGLGPDIIEHLIADFPGGDNRPFASKAPYNDLYTVDGLTVKVILPKFK